MCALLDDLSQLMGAGPISVPEMWGDKRLKCEGRGLAALVGVELPLAGGTGDPRYIRLVAKDAVQGLTYWAPVRVPTPACHLPVI